MPLGLWGLRERWAGGLLQQVFCFIEFGAVRCAFAEFLIEESLLHVVGFGESLHPNGGEKKERTAELKSRSFVPRRQSGRRRRDYDPRLPAAGKPVVRRRESQKRAGHCSLLSLWASRMTVHGKLASIGKAKEREILSHPEGRRDASATVGRGSSWLRGQTNRGKSGRLGRGPSRNRIGDRRFCIFRIFFWRGCPSGAGCRQGR
jgi:hypothetical protein